MLKFDDFAKLEIRICTVVETERVHGTDRLLKIVVDMGNEKRQVVAGFGHTHKAVIGGVESNGIFMALDDEYATLLTPVSNVPTGTKVK